MSETMIETKILEYVDEIDMLLKILPDYTEVQRERRKTLLDVFTRLKNILEA